RVASGVLLIAPVTVEVEERHWGRVIVRRKALVVGIVLVEPRVGHRIPAGALVGVVLDQTGGPGDVRGGVVVGSPDCVVGVGAVGDVTDGAAAGLLLDGAVGEGLTVGVLAVPDGAGGAVVEADHHVLAGFVS